MIWVALLVDDDNRFRSTVARFLRGEGYLVNDAGNGADALRLIEKRAFDLLVSDYDLKSEINGFDVIAKFNQIQPGKGKIVVSGHSELKSGCDALGALFLPKPLQLSDLLRDVQSVVQRREKSFMNSANFRLIKSARSVREANRKLRDCLERFSDENRSLTKQFQDSSHKWKIHRKRFLVAHHRLAS